MIALQTEKGPHPSSVPSGQATKTVTVFYRAVSRAAFLVMLLGVLLLGINGVGLILGEDM